VSPARHPTRRERARAVHCQEVLAAARRLFAHKGYQQTTMAEIARASEFALGTLYRLFVSKEAILRALLEEQVEALLARVREAAAGAVGSRAQVEAVVEATLAFFQDNRDLLRLYLSGWSGYDFTIRQDFGARIDAKYRSFLDLLAAIFRRGIREGTFRRRSPKDLATALAGMLNALIARWIEEKDLDLRAPVGVILDIFFDGALARGSAR
jgi:AcrR family transcriptional regulator